MPGSDNTSYGSHRPTTGRQTPLRGGLRGGRKHIQYLQDVGITLLLAVMLWAMFALAVVMTP